MVTRGPAKPLIPVRFRATLPKPIPKRTSLQAYERSSMRHYVAVDIMINPIYSYTRAARELVSIRSGISHAKRASREKQAAAPNKRRKNENNQTRISSRRREAGRDQTKSNQIPASSNHGNSSSTTRVHREGPEVHRNGIPGSFKQSYKRSSSRVCLELITPAREQRANNHQPPKEAFKRTSVQAFKRPSKQARIADQSSSAQARERTSESPDSFTAELS